MYSLPTLTARALEIVAQEPASTLSHYKAATLRPVRLDPRFSATGCALRHRGLATTDTGRSARHYKTYG